MSIRDSSSALTPAAAAPDAGNGRASLIILLLFIVAAGLSAVRKDVTQGFDEVAHASYVAHIQHTGQVWPALEDMRMLDPATFRFTGEPNYLNHPSPYYAVLAKIGPPLEHAPAFILIHRLINVALAAIGLAALLAIGIWARLPTTLFYAYAVPLACIPVLIPLAGAINNDNAAFAGGALTLLGAWQLLTTGRRSWLWLALGGVVLASWAKLTGLMLGGGFLASVLLWSAWQRRLERTWLVPIVLTAVLAMAPYVALLLQYGSPTPNTPGQIAMLQAGAHAAGWDTAPRMSAVVYAAYFLGYFVIEWMPTLATRNALNYAALGLPIATGLCAVAGIIISARRILARTEQPVDVVVVAGAFSFLVTLVVHIIFSFERHLAFGWMMDAYPRYYLPLLAIVPLACLSLLAGIELLRARKLLIGFLILAPIIFRLIAAPIA